MTTGLAKRSARNISKYDPQKGVGKIRFLEVAKKHYAKARDAENLEKAIRLKWDEQAEFVFWWDTQAKKDEGGRPEKTGRKNTTSFDRLEDFGLDKFVVYQWRKKSSDPQLLREVIASDFQHALARVECERREKHFTVWHVVKRLDGQIGFACYGASLEVISVTEYQARYRAWWNNACVTVTVAPSNTERMVSADEIPWR